MTEYRKITAEEARQMLDDSQEQHNHWPDVLTPVENNAHDLAHTVIEQAEEIADLDAQNERLSTDLFKVTRQRNKFREEARSPMFPPMPEPADNTEQVARLQQAVRDLMEEYARVDELFHDEHATSDNWEPPALEDYDLTPEDMEDQ